MAKYRKKPVVIEAFQYDGDLTYSDGTYYVPIWAITAFEAGVLFYGKVDDPWELYVKTLEGDMRVSVMDYVIQGVAGEIYPCKPDIFEDTYESVE